MTSPQLSQEHHDFGLRSFVAWARVAVLLVATTFALTDAGPSWAADGDDEVLDIPAEDPDTAPEPDTTVEPEPEPEDDAGDTDESPAGEPNDLESLIRVVQQRPVLKSRRFELLASAGLVVNDPMYDTWFASATGRV